MAKSITVAVTSCVRYKKDKTQEAWKDIQDANPDYLFLLGDNIYTDYWFYSTYKAKRMSIDNFKSHISGLYESQWNVPAFKSLINAKKGKVFGTWDDHDCLWDNATGASAGDFGFDSKHKAEKLEISRNTFHKYFENCSTNYPELYYHLDTEFARFIFLDNRSYAELPGKDCTLLGEEQFQFIEEKATNHDKPHTIFCGGLTLTEGVKGIFSFLSEDWLKYPKDLKRLCKLTSSLKSNAYFVAGDIHKNKHIKAHTDKYGNNLPEQIISSGMAMGGNKLSNWVMLEISEKEVKPTFYGSKEYL